MAATYERVLGRHIPIELVAVGEPIPGLPDPMPASKEVGWWRSDATNL